VAMIGCGNMVPRLAARLVDNEPLQQRAKRAGLPQKRLAQIVGVSENTASLQLRGKWESGTPRYVVAALIAWELLDHDARQLWEEKIAEAVSAGLTR